jgi:hypothetical protein
MHMLTETVTQPPARTCFTLKIRLPLLSRVISNCASLAFGSYSYTPLQPAVSVGAGPAWPPPRLGCAMVEVAPGASKTHVASASASARQRREYRDTSCKKQSKHIAKPEM